MPEQDSAVVIEAKQVLLELWYHLLSCIASVPTPHVSPAILRAIIAIVHRPEFSMAAFLSVNNAASCPQHQLSLAHRYRTLLSSTFRYVAAVLSASAIPKDECLSPLSPFFFRINGLLYPCSTLASPVVSPLGSPASGSGFVVATSAAACGAGAVAGGAVPGMDRCYDCAAEVAVATRYLAHPLWGVSHEPTPEEVAELVRLVGARIGVTRKGLCVF